MIEEEWWLYDRRRVVVTVGKRRVVVSLGKNKNNIVGKKRRVCLH